MGRDEDNHEKLMASLKTVGRARYLLDIIDAQKIGTTSDAWLTGVDRLRSSVEEVEHLFPVKYAGPYWYLFAVAEEGPEPILGPTYQLIINHDDQNGRWPGATADEARAASGYKGIIAAAPAETMTISRYPELAPYGT